MIKQIEKIRWMIVGVLLFSVSCDAEAKALQEEVNDPHAEWYPHKELLVVAQDNSGDYTTLREAFQALPNDSEIWTTIQVKR
ncbi:MAG: hypothetical protein EZS26_004045, partial [Candidatus Ordinivivax streblomastigis]